VQVENDLLQEGAILWGAVLAHGAGTLAVADVENPVKPDPDTPKSPSRCHELFGGLLTRTDVVVPLQVRFLVTQLPAGVGKTDRLALGPIDPVPRDLGNLHKNHICLSPQVISHNRLIDENSV
jgi:hypothetical protein